MVRGVCGEASLFPSPGVRGMPCRADLQIRVEMEMFDVASSNLESIEMVWQ